MSSEMQRCWSAEAPQSTQAPALHLQRQQEWQNRPLAKHGASKKKGEVTYEVAVKTGKQLLAGTDSNVYITVIGTAGTTKRHKLDYKFYDDFECGSLDKYEIHDEDVGHIEVILIKMERSRLESLCGDSEWFLEDIMISKGGDKLTFPHHQWVKETKKGDYPLILQSSWTRIPQMDSDQGITARMIQSNEHKRLHRWSYSISINGKLVDLSEQVGGFLDYPNYQSLDHKFRWDEQRYKDYQNLRNSLLMISLVELYIKRPLPEKWDPICGFEEYKVLMEQITGSEVNPEDHWVDQWDSDEEFGRQTMNGANPVALKRATKIPDNFPVTDKDVGELLGRGLTLEEEAEAGNIYLVDYEVLEGIPTGNSSAGVKLEMAAAMGLFYLRPNDELVPIAIQLGQAPGPECPIWTPLDSEHDWLLAKCWLRHADAQVAQIITHLASTHFYVEPFAVALHRCLQPVHPVYKLLKEHLNFIISIDTLGRDVLIVPGGSADVSLTIGHGSDGVCQLLSKGLRTMTYKEDFNYLNNLKARDVMDLPGYHHRDDCVRLWEIILEFVTSIVDVFYKDDDDVMCDTELQDWVADVYENGFGKMAEVKKPSLGLPKMLKRKEELVTYLHVLIFTDTIRHTFSNFYTFQYARFAPNSPTVMNSALPRAKGQATLQTVLEALPTRKQALISASTAKVLSHYAEDEVYLGQTSCMMFGEAEVQLVYKQLRESLVKAEEEMVARNKGLSIPYTVLLPSKIPTGISI